jgi:hypothetical protein
MIWRALSIQQPWAWAILHAGKDVENRSWPTPFRGRVFVHAGKRFDSQGYAWMKSNAAQLGITVEIPPAAEMLRGGIVGAVTVTGCVEDSDSPWFFGEYGFTLAEPEPLKLIPCRGALGFFRPEGVPP